MQQRTQFADRQQATLPQHYPRHSHGSGYSMPWLNQMGYGIPGLPQWPSSLPETSTQRIASSILGWGADGGTAPWTAPAHPAPPQQAATHDGQRLQRRPSARQLAAARQQQAQHSAPTQLLHNGSGPTPQQQRDGGQVQSASRSEGTPAMPSHSAPLRQSPAGHASMPPPEALHRSDAVPSRGDTGGAARMTGCMDSRPIRPQPLSFSGSLSAGGRGAMNLSGEKVSAAISREFGHSLADHNQEGSATSDEVHHPKLIPRAGPGLRLRQGGAAHEIDDYLMRLLRVGAANEAEARLYAQGKRVALQSQPPHQADNQRRNSDASSQKVVQQLTAIVGVSPPPPPVQQAEQQEPHQPQEQPDPQQQTPQQTLQQQAPQQQTPQQALPPPQQQQMAQPQPQQLQQQQRVADDRFLAPPPRRPSSRQLELPPLATEPAAPNSLGSQHAKVSSPRSRSAGDNAVTGDNVGDSAAARARGALSVTPSRGDPHCRQTGDARGGSAAHSGSDRPAISKWRGEARQTESAAGRGDGRGPLRPPRPPSRAWGSAGAAPPLQPDSSAPAAGVAEGRQRRQHEEAGTEQLLRGGQMRLSQLQHSSSGCLTAAVQLCQNLIGFQPPAIGSRANSGAGGEASGDAAQPRPQPQQSAAQLLADAPAQPRQQQQQQPSAAAAHQLQPQPLLGLHPPEARGAAGAVMPDAGTAMAMLGWRCYTNARDVIQKQAAEFRRQLSELHRLATIQQQQAAQQQHQQQQHQQQPWPLQQAPSRAGSQMPWLGGPQVPGFAGMPMVPMILAWDPMAAWYSPQAMPGAYGMLTSSMGVGGMAPPGVGPMQLPGGMAAAQPGLQAAPSGMAMPGMMPLMGWPAPAATPPLPGSAPIAMARQGVVSPAAAWFTPLQAQHHGMQPAGSAAPGAYGGLGMPGPIMPQPSGLPAGMAPLPYMAAHGAAGGPAAFDMPPQWAAMQQQPQQQPQQQQLGGCQRLQSQLQLQQLGSRQGGAQGAGQRSPSPREAPQMDAADLREKKRQKVGRS